MGKAILEKDSNLKRAKLILEGLDKHNWHEHSLKYNDRLKINKITKYIKEKKAITPKQFKALTHYSKIYGVKILQSMDFILD